MPRSDEHARAVVVITDGMISAERAAFGLVREHLGDATLFAFGVHHNVNRHLIEGLAHAGRTEPFIAKDATSAQKAADHFRTFAARPALSDIAVRFVGFSASELEPSEPGDLYPGRPLVMLGKFSGPAAGRVVITGRTGAGPYRRVVEIEDHLERPAHAPLQKLWARERIARLADRDAPTDAQLKEVEALSLRYRVLTERTSSVVVDPRRRNRDGALAVVAQPTVAPAGMGAGSVSNLFGPGGLGAVGMGAGGGGLGYGSGGLGVRGSGIGGVGVDAGNVDRGGRGKSAVSIVPGKVTTLGSLSKDEVRNVITRSMSQLRYCDERRLLVTPTLAGRLDLTLEIALDGRVKSARVTHDTVGDSEVATCVTRVANRWRYPRPVGAPATVSYPLIFTSDR